MAYREIAMWEVLEVLRRIGRGERQRPIARATGHSRTTVRRYEHAARELGWVPGQAEPGEALALAVLAALRPGLKERDPGASESLLSPHRSRLQAWLAPDDGSRGLKLSKVHQLLSREGIEVPYSSLHRFAVRHCGFADSRRVTVRMAESAPGEVAEIDFGRLGLVFDPVTQKRRVHHALIVTLLHSRHQYVHVCISQKLEDVIAGLEAAWAFFGGVVARVVLDNMKAAITKADRYDPVFQRVFAEYADYRGFVIDAAVARHPTGKPTVERSVQYVRENFFRGEQWIDRDHVQREAERWCRDVAGQRIHGTTRQRPLVVFENVEKNALIPLSKPSFDPPRWAECKVHPDHHVQFGKALYSVPTCHVGKTVTVRGDSKLVRIYVKGEVVKTHKHIAEGKRSTDYADYPKELVPYAMRDPERMIQEAHRQGKHLGQFMEALLAGDFPWAKLRQAQKLLRLTNKYGRKRLDAACRRALHFELYNVKRVETIVLGELERETSCPGSPVQGQLIEFPPRFLRPEGSFNHNPQHPQQESQYNGDPSIPQDRTEEAPTLSGLLITLPDRITYAKKTKLSELDFLELILQDEIDRRDHKSLTLRLDRAGFEEEQTFESFDWDAPVNFDRDRVKDLFSLGFIERQEDVIFLGPVGVGKTFLASAIGHSACRVGKSVLFLRAEQLFQLLHQSRADHTTEKVRRRLLAPDVLIVDDFGLRRLTAEQSSDFYEIILERHRRSSTILTSNRAIEEWSPLFDDPMLGQSALDRLAHNAYQVPIEGPSYREQQRPGVRSSKPRQSRKR